MNQVEILAVLREKGPMTAIQIAEALGIHHDDVTERHRALSSVHVKISRLKRSGLVEGEKVFRESVRDGCVAYRVVE